MTLPEILSLSAAVISFITLLVLIIFISTRDKSKDLNQIENTIIEKVNTLEKSVSSATNDALLKFNNLVNYQLKEQQLSASSSMTEFRINVNKELIAFQEKINKSLEYDFKNLNDNIESKMRGINEKVEDRLSKGFSDTNKTFTDIVKRVEVIHEAQENIKTLSNEMVSLQNILTNNQARGAFGEYQLNQLLFSLFGENNKLYNTQYTLKNKSDIVRADAVIFMPNSLICIDSKFPYSSYSKLFDNNNLTKEDESRLISDFGREVKKHITDIANKYIINGVTTDYAIMFVPSDGILAMIHSRLINVVEYSRTKSVTIVSPTTLIPLLSSFQGMVIDFERKKHIDEIMIQLKGLGKNFSMFEDEWNKLNKSIDRLRSDGDKVDKRVGKISTRFNEIDKVSFVEGEKQAVTENSQE